MNIKHLQKLLIFMTLGTIAPVKAMFTERTKLVQASNGLNAFAMQWAYTKPESKKLTANNVGEFYTRLPKEIAALVAEQVVDKSQFAPTWCRKQEILLGHTERITTLTKISEQMILCAVVEGLSLFEDASFSIQIVDSNTGQVVSRRPTGDEVQFCLIALSENRFASISMNINNGACSIKYWQINTDNNPITIDEITAMVLPQELIAVALAKVNETHIACQSATGIIKIYNMETGATVATYGENEEENERDSIPYSAALFDYSTLLIVNNFLIAKKFDTETLDIWRIVFNEEQIPQLQRHLTLQTPDDDEIQDIAHIHNHVIVSLTDNNSIDLWDIESGIKLQTIQNIFNIGMTSKETPESLHVQNNQLICISNYGNFRILDIKQNGNQVNLILKYSYNLNTHTPWAHKFRNGYEPKNENFPRGNLALSHTRLLAARGNKIISYTIDADAHQKVGILPPSQILHLQALQAHIKKLRTRPVDQRQLTESWEARLAAMPLVIRQNLAQWLGLHAPVIAARPINPWIKYTDMLVYTTLISWYAFNRFYRHNREATITSLVWGSILGMIYRYMRSYVYYA